MQKVEFIKAGTDHRPILELEEKKNKKKTVDNDAKDRCANNV
jgi:hypothetical protein